MAGKAWKYSGELDERDLAFLQHEFITVPIPEHMIGKLVNAFDRMITFVKSRIN